MCVQPVCILILSCPSMSYLSNPLVSACINVPPVDGTRCDENNVTLATSVTPHPVCERHRLDVLMSRTDCTSIAVVYKLTACHPGVFGLFPVWS